MLGEPRYLRAVEKFLQEDGEEEVDDEEATDSHDEHIKQPRTREDVVHEHVPACSGMRISDGEDSNGPDDSAHIPSVHASKDAHCRITMLAAPMLSKCSKPSYVGLEPKYSHVVPVSHASSPECAVRGFDAELEEQISPVSKSLWSSASGSKPGSAHR